MEFVKNNLFDVATGTKVGETLIIFLWKNVHFIENSLIFTF